MLVCQDEFHRDVCFGFTHSGRPPARHRAPLAAAVRTHASAFPRPLRSASMVRAARSLRTPAAGAHGRPLLRRSLRGEARRGCGRRSQHGPRGPWGHRSAVLRRHWIGRDCSRAHSAVPARAARKQDRLGRGRGARILLFQPSRRRIQASMFTSFIRLLTPAKETGIVFKSAKEINQLCKSDVMF